MGLLFGGMWCIAFSTINSINTTFDTTVIYITTYVIATTFKLNAATAIVDMFGNHLIL